MGIFPHLSPIKAEQSGCQDVNCDSYCEPLPASEVPAQTEVESNTGANLVAGVFKI